MMRRLLLAVVAVGLTLRAAAADLYVPIGGGTVIAVDIAHWSFVCHWQSGDEIYQTTSATSFRYGQAPASFADLRPGETVRVLYRQVGTIRYAVEVGIIAP